MNIISISSKFSIILSFTFGKPVSEIVMPRPPHQSDLRLLSKVSKLYYEQGLTQQIIAQRLHLSRPKVSRLLQQAIDEGIVQITVLSPPGIYSNLEHQLEQQFGLQEAVVIEVEPSASQSTVSKELGRGAASYLQRTLQDGDTIGISWGTTLEAMVNALQPSDAGASHIVQMIGGLGPPEAETHASELCKRIARLLNSRLTLIPAPGIARTVVVKQALLSDSYVQAAFDLFNKINVAYVGIGAPTPDALLFRSSIISDSEINELRQKGAVGDIALRFFDARGQPVYSDLDERVVGIRLDELTGIERVIAVAGGPNKRDVVHAALSGSLIDVLITDHVLAASLLETRTQTANP
jgi:DNA-binding transcriptional regulator LsrR (DeoR family)